MYYKEEQEEQSYNDWEQEILNSCDYNLIRIKLVADVANALLKGEL